MYFLYQIKGPNELCIIYIIQVPHQNTNFINWRLYDIKHQYHIQLICIYNKNIWHQSRELKLNKKEKCYSERKYLVILLFYYLVLPSLKNNPDVTASCQIHFFLSLQASCILLFYISILIRLQHWVMESKWHPLTLVPASVESAFLQM